MRSDRNEARSALRTLELRAAAEDDTARIGEIIRDARRRMRSAAATSGRTATPPPRTSRATSAAAAAAYCAKRRASSSPMQPWISTANRPTRTSGAPGAARAPTSWCTAWPWPGRRSGAASRRSSCGASRSPRRRPRHGKFPHRHQLRQHPDAPCVLRRAGFRALRHDRLRRRRGAWLSKSAEIADAGPPFRKAPRHRTRTAQSSPIEEPSTPVPPRRKRPAETLRHRIRAARKHPHRKIFPHRPAPSQISRLRKTLGRGPLRSDRHDAPPASGSPNVPAGHRTYAVRSFPRKNRFPIRKTDAEIKKAENISIRKHFYVKFARS